ncbi:hypothetical protein GCM10023191_066680 [Actinoallomurus oryzae]|uniref:Uncharacterized protein n=1 Tax=Actinoallomurus oryzae TaxID=502180 RepID=A0ABP8QPZ5_9ACTN
MIPVPVPPLSRPSVSPPGFSQSMPTEGAPAFRGGEATWRPGPFHRALPVRFTTGRRPSAPPGRLMGRSAPIWPKAGGIGAGQVRSGNGDDYHGSTTGEYSRRNEC